MHFRLSLKIREYSAGSGRDIPDDFRSSTMVLHSKKFIAQPTREAIDIATMVLLRSFSLTVVVQCFGRSGVFFWFKERKCLRRRKITLRVGDSLTEQR